MPENYYDVLCHRICISLNDLGKLQVLKLIVLYINLIYNSYQKTNRVFFALSRGCTTNGEMLYEDSVLRGAILKVCYNRATLLSIIVNLCET